MFKKLVNNIFERAPYCWKSPSVINKLGTENLSTWSDSSPRMHQKMVYVYDGEGANDRCKETLFRVLQENVDITKHRVSFITPEEIIQGAWTESAALLAIGGGYDLGFINALGSVGVRKIRTYVETGGAYLGICAGGYFACDYIEFDKQGPLEVCGERALKFFPGMCVGPVYEGFCYKSEIGSCAAPIIFRPSENDEAVHFDTYFNGGGMFTFTSAANIDHSDTCHSDCGIKAQTGRDICEQDAFNYHMNDVNLNTSATEMPSKGGNSKSRETNLCPSRNHYHRHARQLPEVTVLAKYVNIPHQPAAIVKTVLQNHGVAVLSGVHIEYTPSILPQDDETVAKYYEKLVKSESERRMCFRSILRHLRLSLLDS